MTLRGKRQVVVVKKPGGQTKGQSGVECVVVGGKVFRDGVTPESVQKSTPPRYARRPEVVNRDRDRSKARDMKRGLG